jgi:DNA-binding CsgD family transcriptional regulator
VIRDVAELRERGQVYRRADELQVDAATWRAGMRRAARREGMRIRTYVIPLPPEPSEPAADEDSPPIGDRSDVDETAAGREPAAVVCAVRIGLPPDLNRVPGTDNTSRKLSAREVEVLQLVADGQSNKEIGEALSLSALTIKCHLSRIGRKLGTGDRAQMVALAMRAGVIR